MSGDCGMKRSAAINACKRGEIAKPCSDRRIAGSNSLAHCKCPVFLCAISRARKTPGVPTERPPICASVNAIGVPSGFRNKRSVAPAGAVSRPSYACTVFPSQSMMNAPPPMPDDCGSTRVNTACIAIAASIADPPWRSISRPASAASGLAAAAIWRSAWRVVRSVR